MSSDYKNVNDSEKKNEVNWFDIRGDLIENVWTFDENNNFYTFCSNFNFFVSWETTHILYGFEFAFVQKPTGFILAIFQIVGF